MGAEERDALLKEHRTWQLFRAVYRYAAVTSPMALADDTQ
jgi:hypothetical protein